MQVGQLAKLLNTTPDTVRYYTRIGLLRPRKDSGSDYKYYDDKQRSACVLSCVPDSWASALKTLR